MYGEYQKDERINLDFKLPVVFLPQILGLAMGFDGKKELGMKKKVIKLFLEPEGTSDEKAKMPTEPVQEQIEEPKETSGETTPEPEPVTGSTNEELGDEAEKNTEDIAVAKAPETTTDDKAEV